MGETHIQGVRVGRYALDLSKSESDNNINIYIKNIRLFLNS